MKRLLQFALASGMLLWGAPVSATITLVQHTCNTACAANAVCAIAVSSTGTGNLGAVAEIDDGAGTGPPTISSVSGGGTYTHCANCARANGTNEVDASYTLATTSGATSISVTLTSAPSGTWRACYMEASAPGGFALDTGSTSSCSSVVAAAAPVSCALTVSGANLVIWTAMQWGGTLTGNSAPYTNCGATCQPNGNGSARNLNTTVGTGTSWTPTTSNTGANFSIGFKELSASATGSLPWYQLPYAGPSWAISIMIGLLIGSGVAAGRKHELPADNYLYSVRSVDRNISGQCQPALAAALIEMWLDDQGTYRADSFGTLARYRN